MQNATSIEQIFPDINSIELDFRRTLSDLKKEAQHNVMIEFYLSEQANSLKTILLNDPDKFGTIDDPVLRDDSKTYQVLAGKSELGKPNVPSIRLAPFNELFSHYLDNIDDIKLNLK